MRTNKIRVKAFNSTKDICSLYKFEKCGKEKKILLILKMLN